MRTLILVALLGACASDPPSCDQSLSHFYDTAHCVYIGTGGTPLTKTDAIDLCVQAASSAPSNCIDELNAWLECNNGTPANASNAQCMSCEAELMTLQECH